MCNVPAVSVGKKLPWVLLGCFRARTSLRICVASCRSRTIGAASSASAKPSTRNGSGIPLAVLLELSSPFGKKPTLKSSSVDADAMSTSRGPLHAETPEGPVSSGAAREVQPAFSELEVREAPDPRARAKDRSSKEWLGKRFGHPEGLVRLAQQNRS
eukprot:CAMPEP_0171079072 /NCGR_PEP_ID=MMETSP0766_2-20121228/15024_1 /TAXON_ID=439317 /ORGANISM="Gambierdiscus australes, Strain CAWD 149" /LENGTH=156 /DNA_ID=CAMNT_0011536235 /DNA_START=147 /DNA_END=614 /DNA_ORIENTATION=+